ncbi:hypothetical protein RO3G_12246 [Rhizopus delemar RA 99-880]|uniref:Uncharacterized protein n=1 Tax=Rhizopus delemar (strain RA 99-880 / ATCC MYA-4621 / FGSC 9543 / NRRL 43880) TaxID=246409 RepID=I1CGF5_RHIO9|nr:hypothetical protein RO3G_12246 [Rhizopus delemar RA 99-880]|eukprot:EIE87535.1 hypothetical protein RO3G_12246 [Rhizopus delemar RA 99-880]
MFGLLNEKLVLKSRIAEKKKINSRYVPHTSDLVVMTSVIVEGYDSSLYIQ